MVYTAIFQDDQGRFTSDVYDAPHGFSRAWPPIQEDGRKNGNRCLIALIPGSNPVGFHHNPAEALDPFSQPRRLARWSVS